MQLKRKVSISFVSDIFLSKVLLVLKLSYPCNVSHGSSSSFSSSSNESFLEQLQNLAPELHRVMSCFFIFYFAVDSEVNHSLIALIFWHVMYGMQWCRFTFCVTWINFTAMTILLLWIISYVTLITGNLYFMLFFSVSSKSNIIIRILLLTAFIACMWLLLISSCVCLLDIWH